MCQYTNANVETEQTAIITAMTCSRLQESMHNSQIEIQDLVARSFLKE